MTETFKRLKNYIHGEWLDSGSSEWLNVTNPATAETLAQVPLSTAAEVERAAQAAHQAFQEWRYMPPTERIQYLFELKNLLEYHFDELARLITRENGKTLEEFVAIMNDLDLPYPRKIDYAVPGNEQCGKCPDNVPEEFRAPCEEYDQG